MRMKPVSSEVYLADEKIVKLSRTDVEFLKQQVAHAPRGRVRLCAHSNGADRLHEMVIVLSRDTYIRPHKHLDKSESFHVIEGSVDVVIMDDDGAIIEVVQLGDYNSGRQFYYRLAHPAFHTLLIKSKLLVIHETTNGPFVKGDAIFAPWAPEETEAVKARDYARKLAESVERFGGAAVGSV